MGVLVSLYCPFFTKWLILMLRTIKYFFGEEHISVYLVGRPVFRYWLDTAFTKDRESRNFDYLVA